MDFTLQNIMKNQKKKSTEKNNSVDDLFWVVSKSDSATNSDLNLKYYWNKIEDSYIIWVVNDIFINAIWKRASDVHIEPNDKELLIRFRIDWTFIKYKTFKLSQKDSILARIKIMSFLRIDEHRLPQDWKISYKLFAGKTIDMRVSVIPTIYWEKCVIRLLKKDSEAPKLQELWIMPYNMVKIEKHLKDNYWMILTVWPTWSWKSTTLFWLLSHFDPEQKNISTLEDPVEYRIKWVNHTQINPDINFTFARGLRSLLRQDPDIIMVWEIRDKETATLAVEAALTWHLVLSTIHTNSAAATIQRLINMGIEPFLLASAMKMVMSQRLWKRICPHCKWDAKLTEIQKTKVKEYLTPIDPSFDVEKFVFKEWKWCEVCNWTGYKWRIWFHEVMVVWEYLEPLILKKESAHAIQQEAIKHDMITIVQDALIKAVKWETTVEEAFKLI